MSARLDGTFSHLVAEPDRTVAAHACRVTYDFVRKHGIDAVRLLRMPRNCGKVSSSHSVGTYNVLSIIHIQLFVQLCISQNRTPDLFR